VKARLRPLIAGPRPAVMAQGVTITQLKQRLSMI
jgi:hypothetical protein